MSLVRHPTAHSKNLATILDFVVSLTFLVKLLSKTVGYMCKAWPGPNHFSPSQMQLLPLTHQRQPSCCTPLLHEVFFTQWLESAF